MQAIDWTQTSTTARGHLAQLGFPWRREPLDKIFVTELVGDIRLRLEIIAGDGEVELRMETLPPDEGVPASDFARVPEFFTLELRVVSPVYCRVNGVVSSWNLRAGVDDRSGAFREAVVWALERLEREGLDHGWDPIENRRYETNRAVLVHACGIVSSRAVDMCAAAERRIALQFANSMNMFLYTALLENNRERTMQMLAICPGLFIVAAATSNLEIARGVREGRSLATLIRAALVTNTSRVAAAAVLVRRAPPGIEPSWLLGTIQADGVDINDIPVARKDAMVSLIHSRGRFAYAAMSLDSVA